MANEVKKVEITIGAKSKKGTGIKDGGENWYNASKGVSFDTLQKGDKVFLQFVENGEGGRFVTSYTKTNVAAAVAAPVTQTVATATVNPVVNLKPTDDKMTKVDWEAKDLKITKGGVAHDAATITAAMSAMKSDDEVLALYTKLFSHILKTVVG